VIASWEYAIDKISLKQFMTVILISIMAQAISTLHYYFGVKKIALAKIFNCIQTMMLTVTMTEKTLVTGYIPKIIYVALFQIVTSISFMGTF
jgi:hypothetical protein